MMDLANKGLIQLALHYVNKCNKCGFCRAVCPLLEELGAESAAPRGRVFLAGQLLTGSMPVTQSMADRLGKCLICRHCSAFCPLGVRVDLVLMAARALIAEKIGMDKVKGSILQTLACRWNTVMLFEPVLSVLQGIAMRPVKGGQTFRVNFAQMEERTLPRIAIRPFLKEHTFLKGLSERRSGMRVAFFVGCFVNFVQPELGIATCRVLKENGLEVVVPGDQTCCGTPILTSGKIELALAIIKQNIDVVLAAKPDAVVTSCASCGTSLKEWWTEILAAVGDDAYLQKAHKIKDITYDISEFLVEQVDLKAVPALAKPIKVTYHDSCHLNHCRNISIQPRRILQDIEGVVFVEMEGAADCCGCGGFFSYGEYGLTKKVNEKKIEHIAATGADVIVSGCPGCNVQIRDGLNRFKVPGEVLHTVQVLDQAYLGGLGK